MKRVWKTIGVVVLVVLGFGILGNVIVFTGWPKYTNTKYGFTWYYPRGWELEEEGHVAAKARLAATGAVCEAYGFPNALMGVDGTPQSLDEFVDWFVENVVDGEMIEQNAVEMGGEDARELVWTDESGAYWGVYELGGATGRAIRCDYADLNELRANQLFAQMMKRRFKLHEPEVVVEEDVPTEGFIDESYTEVTTIPRSSWDQDRLPQELFDYESRGYICLPMPFEFSASNGSAEPTVIAVEWVCEKAIE